MDTLAGYHAGPFLGGPMRRLCVAAALLLAPAALSAPPSPAMVVKYREKVMSALANHSSALAMIAKGETDRVGDAVMHATALVELSKTVGALFPEGTGPAPGLETEAKAEIWTQKEAFAEDVKALETASLALLEAAKTGDVAKIAAARAPVGEACGGCHDAFKVDKH
jgi:cytochrome c556